MELKNKYRTVLDKYEINTPLRLAHFFSQVDHESNLKPVSENLKYSGKRLLEVFPKYFNKAQAEGYAINSRNIANRVYANRMGNGDEDSGDGYKYRGRGFIQLTGKSNYKELSKETGMDYINNPDSLLNEADSIVAACWFWKKNKLNELADKDDVTGITKKINGGTNGLNHRIELLKKYKEIFKK